MWKRRRVSIFSEEALAKARQMEEDWEKEVTDNYQKKLNFKIPKDVTESGIPLKCVYTPYDVADSQVEMPGVYPYTRGLSACCSRIRLSSYWQH